MRQLLCCQITARKSAPIDLEGGVGGDGRGRGCGCVGEQGPAHANGRLRGKDKVHAVDGRTIYALSDDKVCGWRWGEV